MQGRATPSREQFQEQLAELRRLREAGRVSALEFRLQSARLLVQLEQAKERRPRYAIT